MTEERKEFEEWWKKHGFGLVGLNIDVKDIVWRGWEARAEVEKNDTNR